MDYYTASADKLKNEMRHLEAALTGGDLDLAVSIAKRVRRESTILVRALARRRDDLHSQEADKA